MTGEREPDAASPEHHPLLPEDDESELRYDHRTEPEADADRADEEDGDS